MNFGVLKLTPDEMDALNDIRDKYEVSRKVLEETVQNSMNSYWNEIRSKYRLHDCPIHVSGDELWYLADATEDEQKRWATIVTRQ